MSYEFKRLGEVNALDEMKEGLNVLAVDGSEVVKISSDAMFEEANTKLSEVESRVQTLEAGCGSDGGVVVFTINEGDWGKPMDVMGYGCKQTCEEAVNILSNGGRCILEYRIHGDDNYWSVMVWEVDSVEYGWGPEEGFKVAVVINNYYNETLELLYMNGEVVYDG